MLASSDYTVTQSGDWTLVFDIHTKSGFRFVKRFFTQMAYEADIHFAANEICECCGWPLEPLGRTITVRFKRHRIPWSARMRFGLREFAEPETAEGGL